MDIDITCDCGQDSCKNQGTLRVGAVYKQGKLLHWNQLYIEISKQDSYTESVRELMLDPKQAKEVMWFLVWQYMPVLRQLRRLFRRISLIAGA